MYFQNTYTKYLLVYHPTAPPLPRSMLILSAYALPPPLPSLSLALPPTHTVRFLPTSLLPSYNTQYILLSFGTHFRNAPGLTIFLIVLILLFFSILQIPVCVPYLLPHALVVTLHTLIFLYGRPTVLRAGLLLSYNYLM